MFAGLTVIELSQVFAGPLASRLFAEFGATVIKVERPPRGDMSRDMPIVRNGRSAYYEQQNRGKLGLCVDLKSPAGRALLWRLVERADVLVDGFAPGALKRAGFGTEAMQRSNERLIICELSALGRAGPLGQTRGYDPIGACYSGVAHTGMDEDGNVRMPSVAMGDAMMAICAFAAIAGALYARERTGKGQLVEASLVDAYMQAHSYNIQGFSMTGGATQTQAVRGGSAHTHPSGSFRTGDGGSIYIVCLSVDDWNRLCACMGDEELAGDPALQSTADRLERRDEITDRINAWLARCGTRDRALELLWAAHVPAAPVLSIGEVIELPHLRQRRSVRILEQAELGAFAVPGLPFRFALSAERDLPDAPELGEHNAQVCGWAGLDDEEIGGLNDAGILFQASRQGPARQSDPTTQGR